MRGVHIWRASLERPPDDVVTMHALLDPAERWRAAKFRGEHDRRRFVVCRAMLRILLGDYTATEPARVRIRVLPGGKPVLDNRGGSADHRFTPQRGPAPGESPHFNLSHCGEMALFAFADREVGIDLERVAPHDDMERVVRHFFSPEETVAFSNLAGMARAQFFFRTWVRKEAYVKATGEGFVIDPARVGVAPQPASYVRVRDAAGVPRLVVGCSVHDLPDIDGHVAAIAGSGLRTVPAIQYRDWGIRPPSQRSTRSK